MEGISEIPKRACSWPFMKTGSCPAPFTWSPLGFFHWLQVKSCPLCQPARRCSALCFSWLAGALLDTLANAVFPAVYFRQTKQDCFLLFILLVWIPGPHARPVLPCFQIDFSEWPSQIWYSHCLLSPCIIFADPSLTFCENTLVFCVCLQLNCLGMPLSG